MKAEAEAEPASATLVLGLGNPLRGDDGIGLAVLERLRCCQLPIGTALVDGGTGGLEITLEFAGKDTVLVIDAARFGGYPGEVRRFDLLATDPVTTHWGTGHAQGLMAALELGRALALLPKSVTLFAIEPVTLEVPLRLSTEVEQAIPEVVAAVVAELTQLSRQHSQRVG